MLGKNMKKIVQLYFFISKNVYFFIVNYKALR